jgi:septal ring factor EnvC (AmiA/AmiB activator)
MKGVPPSEACRSVLGMIRAGFRRVLPVATAAALSAVPAPALSDAPGARPLGKSVLPPLPAPSSRTAAPAMMPAPPALSGTTDAAGAPVAEVPAAPAGVPEGAGDPGPAAGQLAAARREAIAAARRVQQQEHLLAAIQHEINLLRSDADAGRRGLAESRAEQARLLGAILSLARSPEHAGAPSDAPPIERLRAEALMREADPALRAQLRALAGEIARLAALQERIAAGKAEKEAAQQVLAAERERLAVTVARRNALLREMLPPQSIDAALHIADVEREATGIGDLIRRAEAAEENRGRPRERSRTGGTRGKPMPPAPLDDPTRPSELRSLSREAGRDAGEASRAGGRQPDAEQDPVPRPLLVPPVAAAGASVGRDAAPDAPDAGVSLGTVPGAVAVAPFDGRIIYAGPFRDFGRVLIIRHDHRYYSLLAGLDRVDSKLGDWVLAGEPVGAVPDVPFPRSAAAAQEPEETDPGRSLYFELRRDGRPVDPQPWLASVEDERDKRNGEQKVRQ